MKILSVDTATEGCSAAITEGERLVVETTAFRRQTHSRHLMEIIDALLNMAGLTAKEVDGFAVSRGPGSFTGLRIGMSAVKGMALAAGKPAAGISTLEALAHQTFPYPGLICPMLDARKGEVYTSRFRWTGQTLTPQAAEAALSPEAAAAGIDESALFIGNGALLYRHLISEKTGDRAVFVPDTMNHVRGSTLGRLAFAQFTAGEGNSPGALIPAYIRRSDAELNFRTKA